MKTTQQMLATADDHLAESIGKRNAQTEIQLAPKPVEADIGRLPAPEFGRIEVSRLQPDPSQPRLHFDAEAIERLAASLKSAGQLAPIRARWSNSHKKWLIVAGERRWRAAQHAGLDTVDCFFYQAPLDEGEILRLQLVENLLRENLKPIEEARGFRRLMQQQGYTGKQVAEELSVPESKVSRSLALLRLPEDIQQQVDEGKLAPRVAYELTKVASQGNQQKLAALAVSGKIGIKDICGSTLSKKKRSLSRKRGVRLIFPLDDGWNVTVSRRRKGNYHEVEQALVDALEDVRTRIRGGVQLF